MHFQRRGKPSLPSITETQISSQISVQKLQKHGSFQNFSLRVNDYDTWEKCQNEQRKVLDFTGLDLNQQHLFHCRKMNLPQGSRLDILESRQKMLGFFSMNFLICCFYFQNFRRRKQNQAILRALGRRLSPQGGRGYHVQGEHEELARAHAEL